MRPAAILGALLGATVATGATAQVRTPRATQPVAAPAYGPAPTNAKAVATGPNTIAVSWDAVAGVRSYLVQRKRIDNPSCCVAMSGAITAAGWVDGTLEPGVEYGYAISVYYVDGRTGSVEVGAVTPMPPLPTVTLSRTARMAASGDVYSLTPCARRTTGGPSPVNLREVAQSPGGLTLEWYEVPYPDVNYVVDRAPEGTVDWVMIGSTCGGPSRLERGTVTVGNTVYRAVWVRDIAGGITSPRYVYRVTAIGQNGETGWNTFHWQPPCAGGLSLSQTVQGNMVEIKAQYAPCSPGGTTTNPEWVTVTTSYGFSGRASKMSSRDFTLKLYGVPLGSHTVSARAEWYNGGSTYPNSTTVTVSY